MRNYKFSLVAVWIDTIMTGRVFWVEATEQTIHGQTIRRSREVCTDKNKKGYFTTTNGMDFYCGPVTSEEYRCIDLSMCKTLSQCKKALKAYYDAINRSEDKYPGKVI